MRSEEQKEFLGPCLDCGASCYRLPHGRLISDDPAPGCLCRVEEEGEIKYNPFRGWGGVTRGWGGRR